MLAFALVLTESRLGSALHQVELTERVSPESAFPLLAMEFASKEAGDYSDEVSPEEIASIPSPSSP